MLEGSPNFRDVGGYKISENLILRKGIIFRSGELSKITMQDADKISQLNIKTIIDMRMPNERKSSPDKISTDSKITVYHIPFYPTEKEPGRLKNLLILFNKERTMENFMRNFYKRLTHQHFSQIKSVIEILSIESNLPAIIHCTGGKDRTGVLTAFIQLLAGVSKNDVFYDYLLTNDFLYPHIQNVIKNSIWFKIFNISMSNMRPMFEARRYYLEEVISGIINDYGDISSYLTTQCGISQETIITLQKLLQSTSNNLNMGNNPDSNDILIT